MNGLLDPLLPSPRWRLWAPRNERKESRRSRWGHSLAELVVALGVLIPVLIVTTGLFPYVHLANRQARSLVHATDLARSQFERLRGTPFDDLVSGNSVTRVDRVEFLISTRVEPGPADDLRRVTVTVTWTLRRPEQLIVRGVLVR
ncbi:MAG: hypothetical protein AB1758_33835 [Candidatus Eremiobacterota bacterium]